MIEEDYVSYEVAKLLKEKGFDETCIAKYRPDGSIGFWSTEGLDAPTHQMAMKWLRGRNFIIVIQPEYFSGGSECSAWGCDIWADDNYEKPQGDYPTYEEATEAALKYCLENLI